MVSRHFNFILVFSCYLHGHGFMGDTSMKFDGRYVPLTGQPICVCPLGRLRDIAPPSANYPHRKAAWENERGGHHHARCGKKGVWRARRSRAACGQGEFGRPVLEVMTVSATFEPRLDILPACQRRLWPELDAVPPEFVLYGGTGLALQLGHRDSED
jgi:hypothetical protein